MLFPNTPNMPHMEENKGDGFLCFGYVPESLYSSFIYLVLLNNPMTKMNTATRFRGIVKLSPKEMELWKKNVEESRILSFKYEKEKQEKFEKRMAVLNI